MGLRKAKLKDAVGIYSLINSYAKEGLLLPRSLNSIYENIRDFWVYEEEDKSWDVLPCMWCGRIWRRLKA